MFMKGFINKGIRKISLKTTTKHSVICPKLLPEEKKLPEICQLVNYFIKTPKEELISSIRCHQLRRRWFKRTIFSKSMQLRSF